MSNGYIWLGIAVMAGITYLIRCLPMVLFSAMTVPAVFTSTGSVLGAAAGTIVAVILSYFRKSLLTVAISASLVAFVFQYFGL